MGGIRVDIKRVMLDKHISGNGGGNECKEVNKILELTVIGGGMVIGEV